MARQVTPAVRRSAHLARACRCAHIQLMADALNAWAMNPTAETRRAATRAMDRYANQVREGTFPAADAQPFGSNARGQRYGLPADLQRLLREAREILPRVIEAEQQAKAKRSADARKRSQQTRQAAKVAASMGATSTLLPWE